MRKRETNVWHSSDEGFVLEVSAPTWRSITRPIGWGLMNLASWRWIPGVSDVLHITGNKIVNWEERKSSILARVPIDRETADKLAYTPDDWTWLDD